MRNVIMVLVLLSACELKIKSTPTQEQAEAATSVEATGAKSTIDYAAFTAVKQQNKWILTLKPKHFASNVKSVSVTYNDIFYGVYLVADTIYLPILVQPKTDIIISPLDVNGNATTSESYILE